MSTAFTITHSRNLIILLLTWMPSLMESIKIVLITQIQELLLSRKGSQRGGCGAEKKSNSNANDRDATLAASSPRGPGTPEKPAGAAIGSTDIPQVHHQITITTGNIITTPDSKSGFKRNSLKRSSHSWAIDPKRVLLFFATLSSLGTILLIYFTLSLKHSAEENNLDYKS
ncbi:hypothetical protein CICLE_v10016643mg [Citrus x clementina]|uniref:Uncharacterized protein n=1 Tax=Citrus clementina TaxID=85681 RepID=V4TP99_CITCL|nr:hypothetical protein CICLE_v10016643mg [Citrus x clementina]